MDATDAVSMPPPPPRLSTAPAQPPQPPTLPTTTQGATPPTTTTTTTTITQATPPTTTATQATTQPAPPFSSAFSRATAGAAAAAAAAAAAPPTPSPALYRASAPTPADFRVSDSLRADRTLNLLPLGARAAGMVAPPRDNSAAAATDSAARESSAPVTAANASASRAATAPLPSQQQQQRESSATQQTNSSLAAQQQQQQQRETSATQQTPASLAAQQQQRQRESSAAQEPIAIQRTARPPTQLPAAPQHASVEFTVPTYAHWFRAEAVHEIERRTNIEFFNGVSPSKTPASYALFRNAIVDAYRVAPATRLSFGAVRGRFVADVMAVHRVWAFLDSWGIINFESGPARVRSLSPLVPTVVIALLILLVHSRGVLSTSSPALHACAPSFPPFPP